jgi:DNA-binding CsgD family transcriptional regulator
MERRFHRGFTAAEKTELWDRWKRGESLKAIGRAFGKQSSSIYFLVAPHGGIRPAERRRSRLALTLAEREVISRGVTAHRSARSIAKLLGRSPSTVSREMSRNGVLLNIAGLGIFCWALFALAIHALPFFVGMTVGIYSFQAGAGPFGAIVVGFIMAGFTLVVGQYAFSAARSPVLRLVIGLLFALPAARAGYDATLALAHVGVSPGWWREVFAVFGAVTVGCTAWARVSILTEPASGGSVAPGPAQSPIGAVTKGR